MREGLLTPVFWPEEFHGQRMLAGYSSWNCKESDTTEESAVAPYSSTLAWEIPWMERLVGCSPWGHEELDTTEWFHFSFSLSCNGEGHGIPLQCSCLENPRDGGTWWAAVYGVAQSWTRLK